MSFGVISLMAPLFSDERQHLQTMRKPDKNEGAYQSCYSLKAMCTDMHVSKAHLFLCSVLDQATTTTGLHVTQQSSHLLRSLYTVIVDGVHGTVRCFRLTSWIIDKTCHE